MHSKVCVFLLSLNVFALVGFYVFKGAAEAAAGSGSPPHPRGAGARDL